MKKSFIFLCTFITISFSLAEDKVMKEGPIEENVTANNLQQASSAFANFDQKRWKQLMVLIDSEIKTIKGNRYSGAELKHRLFELYTEKIKLIKEKENLNLLKATPEMVLKKGKESFFTSSQKQYKTAQAYAYSIVKQYPKYKRIADIYYAMAINSRDYGTSEDTERFLKQSIAYSTNESKTMYYSQTALAEYYYNNKRYHEAVGYYTSVLKNTDSEWYGKHLYNAGWCYLKERNFKHALDLIKLSFETSKNKKYVSMQEQIISAIGIFFVQADATYEGIEFFEANTNPSSTHLLRLAQSSISKNTFSITQDVLKAALADTKKKNDPNAEMKIRLGQLDIYRESKKDDLFFETANSVLDLHKKSTLDKDDLFMAQNKIKEIAGFMQINLIKDKTQENVEYGQDDYKKIMRYFDILAIIDLPNKNLYRYYQGETALSAHNFQVALKYYVRSIINSKLIKKQDALNAKNQVKVQNKNQMNELSKDQANENTKELAKEDINKKSLEAILATIELAKLPKEKENQYTIFTFKNFVISYPQSEKSQAIYQKLFNKYFELNKVKKAVNVLMAYTYYYPADANIHREMLTQVLDSYIKQKNTDKLAFWIEKIEKGYLQFSTDYIQKSIAALGDLLFSKYQMLEKKGQIKEAMIGYESIFDSKKYPKRTKAEAAYAISALSLEQNKSKESYKWLKKSLDIYEDRDLIKVTASLYILAKGYRLLQNFDISNEVALMTSRRFCKDSFERKEDFYQLISENATIHNTDVSNLLKFEEEFKSCGLGEKLLQKSQADSMERLIFADRYLDTLAYFKAKSSNLSLKKMMEKYLTYKYQQDPKHIEKDILALQSTIDLTSLISQHQNVITFVKKIKEQKFTFSEEEKFNEEKFNQELEQYFSIIGELNNEAIALSKKSNTEESIMIRNALGSPYFSLVNSIKNYIPKGVDNKYLEGFQQGMRQITEALNAKGLQVDKEKMAFLGKNNYFFEIQKNDIFEEEKNATAEKALHYHSAILFSNTLDIGNETNNRIANGK